MNSKYIIFPTILILVASFFSYNLYQNTQIIPFKDLSLKSITGYDVLSSTNCPTERTVIKLSSDTNAHAELFSQSNYNFAACSSIAAASRNCQTDPVVIKLTSPTNAHVYSKDSTVPNLIDVCFSNLDCKIMGNTCDEPGAECLMSLSSNSNAHAARCDFYDLKLCCTAQGAGPGCGDGTCDSASGETCSTCSQDCGTCPTNCGDNICNASIGEDCSTCSQDCGTCPPPDLSDCTENLTSSWLSTSAVEGDQVSLRVTGTDDCNSQIFQFNVFDINDIDESDIITIDPQPATFQNGKAESSWIAEFHGAPAANKYSFIASTTINATSFQVQSTNLLTVTNASAPVCGNGRVEGSNNETCDDGNQNNNDGCSNNCTLQGSSGSQCSDQCSIPTLGTCISQSQIKFCGQYDGDSCLDLSNPQPCPSGQTCSNDYGSCIPIICENAFTCTDFGECINGKRTRTCTQGSTNPSCSSYTPLLEVSCTESPSQEFPVFTKLNILVTLLVLILYYIISTNLRSNIKKEV